MSSKPAASNMTFQFSLKSIIDYEMLEVQDLLRSAAMIVAFVVLLFRDSQRLWAMADGVGMALCGMACYFFPQSYMQYQVDTSPDLMHQYLLQVCGAYLIGMAAMRYCSLETRDHYCVMANILSRFLGITIMLISMIYAHTTIKTSQGKAKFTQQHISYAILGSALWWAAQLVQLCRAFGNPGRRGSSIAVHNRRDIHLLINGLILMSGSLFNFGFPDAAFSSFISLKNFTPDLVHLHFARCLGIFGFMAALYCVSALNFESDTDKKSVFFGSLVSIGMALPVMILYQWKHGIFSNPTIMIVLAGVQTINVLMGYCDQQCCTLGCLTSKFKKN